MTATEKSFKDKHSLPKLAAIEKTSLHITEK